MATTNGVIDHVTDDAASAGHLGKRKRSTSPEKKANGGGEDVSAFQQGLRRRLQNLSQSSPVSSLLKQSLPSSDVPSPEKKRARLSSDAPEDDSIEQRISSGLYTSFDQIQQDLSRLRDAISNIGPTAQVNGGVKEPALSPDSLQEAADKLAEILSSDGNPVHTGLTHRTGQVITLRSQTEKGVQQLYSGLQKDDGQDGAISSLDGRKLPNGFDLTDPATMDTNMLAPTKDARLFGDVFRPHRSLKPLEVPRTSRTAFRKNTLTFAKEPNLEQPSTLNRNDYRFQQLPVSPWLNYSVSDQQSNRKTRGKSFISGDLRTALMANDLATQDDDDASTLFRNAFSSFAPTTDTSKAVVSESDRDRRWWSKNGSKKLRTIFKSEKVDPSAMEEPSEPQPASSDDFAEVVSAFEPVVRQNAPAIQDEPENVDEVLAEVSELLETVHSYQKIRSVDTRASIDPSKPSSEEFDSYELLRSQLAILISSLPPFAVAKLDGDKLEDLNISTNIIVDTIDYRGTAQPDEYTLSRYRAAQGTPATAARPLPATQPRTQYQTPSIPRYNTNNNLQAYAQNLGVAAARYSQPTNYQTPPTLQRPYQTPFPQPLPASNYSSQPTVQQFQRPSPTPNGYGNYTPANTTAQAQVQTPSQPNYQTNALNKLAHGMNMNTPATAASPSPNKPMVSGQQQTAQAYFGTGQSQAGTGMGTATPYHRATIQQQLQQAQAQRMNATPTPGGGN